jgi:hypothetical protein
MGLIRNNINDRNRILSLEKVEDNIKSSSSSSKSSSQSKLSPDPPKNKSNEFYSTNSISISQLDNLLKDKEDRDIDRYYEYKKYFPYWNISEILKNLIPKHISEVASKR